MNLAVRIRLGVRDDRVKHRLAYAIVACILIGNEDRASAIYKSRQELADTLSRKIARIGNPRNDPAAALDRADHRHFLGAAPALVRGIIIASVALARLTANVGFVGLNDTMQEPRLIGIGSHRSANSVHHRPYGWTAHTQIASDLIGAGRLLRIEH